MIRPTTKSVALLIVGILMAVAGAVGLACVISEVVWPGSQPLNPIDMRLREQGSNLLVMLALPGGLILVFRSIRQIFPKVKRDQQAE